MKRLVVLPAVLLALAGSGCRGSAGDAPPPVDRPGASVEQRLDDIESTLDAVESELNDG